MSSQFCAHCFRKIPTVSMKDALALCDRHSSTCGHFYSIYLFIFFNFSIRSTDAHSHTFILEIRIVHRLPSFHDSTSIFICGLHAQMDEDYSSIVSICVFIRPKGDNNNNFTFTAYTEWPFYSVFSHTHTHARQ